MIDNLKDKVLSGGNITIEEALYLTTVDTDKLYDTTEAITRPFMTDSFDMCSIITAKSVRCS